MRRNINYRPTPNRHQRFPKRLNLIVPEQEKPPLPVLKRQIREEAQHIKKDADMSDLPPLKIANVAVPQGVGDIFWVYQKLYNYFDEIHFRVFIQNPQNHVEQRSVALLKEFPKVANVVVERRSRKDIHRLFNQVYYLDAILEGYESGVKTFDFSCNYWLDRGHKLEDLDRNFEPVWNIPMPVEDPGGLPEKYLTLYASGHCLNDKSLWQADQWAVLVQNFHQKTATDFPVQIIGADFDEAMMLELEKALQALNITSKIWISPKLAHLCYLLKNTEYFFGYQSGLNVLADNLDTSQIMVYFNYLRAMQDAWVKPDNRTNGKFRYGYFKQTAGQLAELISYQK